MRGSGGLDFSQGHFVDPMAGLQQQLGAGGIFAKTLSNMQQFDQDEAKLQMMRQDRERQAKLDAEAKAEKDALKAEKAANTGLRSALFDGQIKDAATSLGYENLSAADKAAIDTKSDYAGLNTSNANAQNKSYLDQLSKAGVKAGDSLFDDLSYRVANYKDGDNYDGTIQVSTAKDVYRKLGMDDKKALSLASKDYGVSESDASDMLKRNSLQSSLGQKANEMATAAPYQETDSKIVHDYISKVKASGGLVTDGMLDSAHESRNNDIKALAEHQKLLDSYNEKLAAKQGEKEDKQLATNIEMTKMKMQNLENGLRLLTGRGSSSSRDDDGLNSKTVKHTYETDALNAVYSTLKGITNSGHAKNASAVREATVMADTMIRNGASPAQIQNTLRASLLGQNEGEKSDAFNKLTFKSPGGYEKLRASPEDMARYEYAGGKSSNTNASAAYKAEADSSLALLKQMASGGTASIDAQIGALNKKVSELNRTPGQALKDTATHDIHQWAVESGLSGAVADDTARDNIYKSTHKDSSTGAGGNDKKLVAPSNVATGNRAFDLPKEVYNMDKSAVGQLVRDKSAELIRSKEGTKPGIYNVDTLNKDGSVSKIPHIGYGLQVANVAKENGMSVAQFTAGYNNPAIQAKYAAMAKKSEENNLTAAYNQANKMAADAGLTLEAVPVLASTIYNLGPAWADKDNKKGFYKRWELIKQGEFTKAADGLDRSLWSKQAPGRPQDFVAMLNDQATRKGTKFYTPTFKEIASPKQMDDKEYQAMQQRLIESISKSKQGISRPDNITNVYADRVASQQTHDYRTYLTPQESMKLNDVNTRFVDKWSIKNDAEARMGVREVQDKARALQMEARNEYLSNDLVTKHGLGVQYKNAKTESQRKLIENTAKLMEADQENAERGAALKSGLFH